MPGSGLEDDPTPKRIFPEPQIHEPPQRGHVMVMIEYRIDPDRAADFSHLMLGEGRRSRLRHGALSWELLHDIHEPSRFVEVIVDESWTDHLRRFDRVTAADVALRKRYALQGVPLADNELIFTNGAMEALNLCL